MAASSSHQQRHFAPGELSEEESEQQFVHLVNVDQASFYFVHPFDANIDRKRDKG